MSDDPRTHEARRAVVAAERAAWPALYATVRAAIARGFWPDAYGGAEPPAIQRPPTKFAFPAGGLAHPHHAKGRAAGSRFWVWSDADGSPDGLAERPIWLAGDASAGPFYAYRCCAGLTLEAALDLCAAMGRHHRAHYVVPEWHPTEPALALPGGVWRALAADPPTPEPVGQLALVGFGQPARPDRDDRGRAAIRRLLRPSPDGERQWLMPGPGEGYAIERLIENANIERARRLFPEPVVLGDPR